MMSTSRCTIRAFLSVLLLLAPVLSFAQQGNVTTVPRAGALYSGTITTTTILTATPVMLLSQQSNGTDGTGGITGTHSVIGYQWQGAATACYIQIFDTGPLAAQVSVGTTVPLVSLPVQGSSSLGLQSIGGLPLWTMSSTLVAAATTTPTGSTACPTSPVGFLIFK